MKAFEIRTPHSMAEAVALLDRDDPEIRPVGGGTALMLMMKAGFFRPQRLVSLAAVEARFRRVSADADGTLRIGAMIRLAELEHSPEVLRHAPVIGRTLRRLANVRVRNVATLGGHLAHADPHLDLPPVLVALAARLTIIGPAGERQMPVEDLFSGYLQTNLRHNELIAEITVPSEPGRRAAYVKWTARSADDWPSLGVAVALGQTGSRIVLGAASEKPLRLANAESILGRASDETSFARAGDAAAYEAVLHSDQHGSAAYKAELLRVQVRRALAAAST